MPLTVPVFDLRTLRTRFVSEGAVATAVAASCAVPLLFRPVRVQGRPSLDGGMLEKAGLPPAPAAERSLCIFVQSTGLTGAYERKTSRHHFGANRRALRFAALPRVLPHDLESGQRAYAEAYARTQAALRAPAQVGVQNA
jgi:NTE family protein